MKRIQINKEEFDKWANEKFMGYASCSRPVPGRSNVLARLAFSVSIAGVYKVELGNEILYEGKSFTEAQAAFNDAA